MEKGRIEFLISFLEPGRNSVQNGNVQLFCYINYKLVFSKTISKLVSQPIAQLYILLNLIREGMKNTKKRKKTLPQTKYNIQLWFLWGNNESIYP